MTKPAAGQGYRKFAERIDKLPQGAPPSSLLFDILKILMTESEAGLLSLLPMKPFKGEKAAVIWKKSIAETKNILDNFADRGLIMDIDVDGESVYLIPPPMAGFFEFSMMHYRNDIDQKALAELYYKYLNVEDDFVRQLFTTGETQLGRVFVNESALTMKNSVKVLDYEKATEVIKTSPEIGIGVCYCRHKMNHLGRACKAPMEICMTFNNTAHSLIKHGIVRKIDSIECIDLLEQAYGHNLVQFGDNGRRNVSFICNCCGCCCEAMLAAKRFGHLNPVHTTNFIPEVSDDNCTGCGKCVDVCPAEAMSLVSANTPDNKKKRKARLNADICLGCGVCMRNCPAGCINLVSRPERVITPMNSVHRSVLMAIERGKLQNFIYDNHALRSHRAMSAVLGVILKLPPIKQAMALKQVRSRYLEYLITKLKI
ncbi:MAG: 4Fe-4S dicluster domain-containing protein [Spirochaetes bacterium]|jgi:ferredoxin|nr:4Fe-4S dicluster domain-containing protein [Spirochaetota bacterium]